MNEDERRVSLDHDRPQLKKVRKDGWTAKKRDIFLDQLAATANATESAKTAGMHVSSAFALRRRDAQFAADWDAALAASVSRLEAKTIVWAETEGARRGAGEADENELDGFDPEAALRTIALYHNRSARRQGRRGGPRPHTATREELEVGALRALRSVRRRIERSRT